MVKDRRFLVGLGCGLMAGALLLQVMLFGEQQQEKLLSFDGTAETEQMYSQAELDELLAEQARELEQRYGQNAEPGTVEDGADSAGAGNGQPPVEPENGAGGSPSAEAGGGDETGESGESGESGEATGVEKPGGGEEATVEGVEQQPTEEPAERTMVYIRTGMTLQQTAALLADNGLIDREQALIDLMRKDSRRIRAGWFLIEGLPTLEELAEILTNEPISTVRPG